MSTVFLLFGWWLTSRKQLKRRYEFNPISISREGLDLISITCRVILVCGLPIFAYYNENRIALVIVCVTGLVLVASPAMLRAYKRVSGGGVKRK